MRDALENITLLQKRMNELQLENQILKGILERSGISYINELKKYQYQEKTGLWEENQGGRIKAYRKEIHRRIRLFSAV